METSRGKTIRYSVSRRLWPKLTIAAFMVWTLIGAEPGAHVKAGESERFSSTIRLAAAGQARQLSFSFEKAAPGNLPEGWRIDATNPKGKLAEWKVRKDTKTRSGSKVLSVTKIHDNSSGVFNLCLYPQARFANGVIKVRVRADTGAVDQGGGPVWRAKNAENYYIARYNPLEFNFRLYYVKNGIRRMLADAGGLDIKTGVWFTIKIAHQGNRIEAWLNGEKLIEVTDSTFQEAGGVGLWTKADAVTSFDDFTARFADRY